MPEVAVDENDDTLLGEYEVRATRERPHVLPVPVAAYMKRSAYGELDIRAYGSHALHAPATLRRGKIVRHTQESDV